MNKRIPAISARIPLMNIDTLPIEQYLTLLDEKSARLRKLFSDLSTVELEVYDSPRKHFRMRAEFRIWHDKDDCYYAMFKSGQKASSNTLIRINNLPIAGLAINQLMHPLLKSIRTQAITKDRIFTIEFLSTLSGNMLVTLIYHKKLNEKWEAAARILEKQFNIHIIGRSRKQKIVLTQDYVIETLNIQKLDYHYKQIEGSFTQPNAHVCTKMANWTMECAKDLDYTKDMLELYCGNGNFTLPLASQFQRILATEISKASVHATQWNIEKNNIDNIQVTHLSSEEFTKAYTGLRKFKRLKHNNINIANYNFNTVFVNPPRVGIDTNTLQVISQFDNIIYISCNPNTLYDNMKTLQKTHNVERFALFDQFPYTHHIESGLLLRKK